MHDATWMERGSCKGKDLSIWFPSEQDTKVNTALAKSICSLCPVRVECTAYAMTDEPYGTWGGLDETERELLRYTNGQKMLMPVKARERISQLKALRNDPVYSR